MPPSQPAEGDPQPFVEVCPPIIRNGFTILYGDSNSKIDLVFLHGLNGHPKSTWTHNTTDFFWPWELRRHIPDARVLCYGYDSDVSPQLGTNLIRIKSLAASFLSNLVNKRQEDHEIGRPLVFIGHSLGGLIIKKALIQASQTVITELDDAHRIYQATKGLIFFGTPHAGSAAGKKLRVQTLKLIAKVAFTKVPPKLDSALESHSDELLDLADDFRTISLYTKREISIYSYAESRTTPKLGAVVVDEFSAFVGYDKEVRSYIQADHEGIVKFDGETDADYTNVWGKINRLKRLAISVPAENKQQSENSMEEITILRCLNQFASHYEDLKHSHSSRRVEGTCLWFLSDETYKTWLNQNTKNVLLFCDGPGSGKSVLSAFLIDELKRRSQTNANWTICYFFFQENNYSLRTVTSALCALLLQLFDDESSLLVHAVKEYRIKGQKFAEDFHALSRIFGQVVQHHPREKVICIIDGLDECEETGRDLLIDRWVGGGGSGSSQATDTACQNKLKFFVTSRYGWIERRFTHSSILRPDAAAVNKAVNKEIAIVVESEVSELGLRMKLSAELQTTLKARLVANAGHTFLWVSLTLDQFRRRKDFTGSEKQCWAILNDLPADLNAAYERILKRSTDRRLAQKILHIIIAAARPLTLVEIDITLAIEVQSKSTKDLQSSRFPFIESSIQDICGGLVKIIGTQPSQKIDLVHHTAKEFLVTRSSQPMPRDQGFLALSIWAIYCVYFPVIDFLAKILGLWKHSLDPVESDRVLAEICVTYLFFEEFSNYPLVMNHEAKAIDIRGTVDRYAREYDFLDYAATHWAAHFRKSQYRAQATLMQAALELCDTKSKKFQTWFGVYWALVDSLWPCPENLTALMAGSLCGHKRSVEFLLQSHEVDIAAKDDSGRTALMWAVENGHEDVAHLLLQNGADVNAKDTNEWNALHKAIEKGYKELAQLLQVNGVDVSAVTQRGHSGIHFAARNGFHDLVQLMLDCEVDVNIRSAVGEIGKCTAMHFAAMNGHKEVVSLLFKNGADVNAETGLIGENLAQYTPLHFAVVEGHLEVAELLLENGGLLAARDAMGETPLHKAASSGHEEMTALLLSKATFVDIDSKTETGETPLHLAVKKKDHAAATCLLLKGNASVGERDKNGALALHYAAAKGNHVAVQELIARGADILARDYDEKSVLHYAARCQEHTVALVLLEENADIEAQDADEMTALHDAAVHGNDDVVAFLLSKGANPCARDYDGKTALHHAVAKGRDAVFKLLLANPDVDPNSRDNAGRTPLSWAVPNFYRSENVVEQMLRCERIHPDSRDNDGRTPLSWAVQFMQINDPVASLLIDIGRVDPDSRDNNGRTPLSWTVQHIHSDIPAASLLLETGRVDPDSRDNNGRTPLSWAVQFMHSNDIVISLLLKTYHVDPDSRDNNGRTPLSWAVQFMKIDDHGPSLLLDTGRVDPDSKDKYGRTPLSWAMQNDQHDQWDREAAVKFLLGTERVDINSKDMDGRTPLSWAAGESKSKIVQLLVKTDGIQPDLPDINGRTPLSWAAQHGDPPTVKVLLDTGRVAPEKCDRNGRTPLMWAREKGNNDVFDLLIRYQRRYVYKDQLGAIDGRYEMEIGYESGDQMEESEELGRRYSI